MKSITTEQINSLEEKIYSLLMGHPDMGIGEQGECLDSASNLVWEWMQDNNILEFDAAGVDIKIKLSSQNDTFSHEFGTEKYESYLIIESSTWDQNAYSDMENKLIEKYIEDNQDYLINKSK